MSTIYRKIGRPLQVSGDDLFSRSGKHVARLDGDKAYGRDGRYTGTLVGDRLVYRSTDKATISSPFARQSRAGSAAARVAGSALSGDEPPIPD